MGRGQVRIKTSCASQCGEAQDRCSRYLDQPGQSRQIARMVCRRASVVYLVVVT